jgi:hypothetical protein
VGSSLEMVMGSIAAASKGSRAVRKGSSLGIGRTVTTIEYNDE